MKQNIFHSFNDKYPPVVLRFTMLAPNFCMLWPCHDKAIALGLCSSPIALICEEFKQNATNLSCTRPYYLNEASIELLGELSTVLSTCSCKQNSKEGGCSKTKGLAAPSGAGPGRWCNIGCQEAPIRAGSLPGPGLGVHDGPAPDGYVTESSQTFIHWDSVRSHAEAASRQAPTLASHAPVPLIPTPPCCLPSHAPGFQPSAMEDASSPRERKKLQGSITSERGVPAATYRWTG